MDQEGFKRQGRLERLKQAMYSRLNQPQNRPRRRLRPKRAKVPYSWQKPQTADPHDTPLLDTETYIQTLQETKRDIQQAHYGRWWLLVVSATFAIVSLIVAVVAFVGAGYRVSPERIVLDVEGPSSVNGGDILELHITVVNDNPVALESTDLVISYPPGTRVPERPSQYMQTQRIQLGTIAAGGKRTGTVRAAVFAPEGTKAEIKVELEYRAAGTSAIRTKETIFPVLFVSDPIALAVDMPKEAVAGQLLDITVDIASQTTFPLTDVVLQAKYPFGFEPKAFSLVPTESENFWYLGTLEPGKKKTIKIRGAMMGQQADERTFQFIVGFRKTGKEDPWNPEHTQQEAEKESVGAVLAMRRETVKVHRPFLALEPVVGKKPFQQDFAVAYAGESLPIEINWRNELEASIYNLVIVASVYGTAVDPYNIFPDKGFYDSKNSIVVWNKTTTGGELAEVASGARGRVFLRLTPLSKERLVGKENPVINIDLNAAAQRISETGVRESLESVLHIPIRIASSVSLETRALYYANPFTSSGPLPPRIHQETTYAIEWVVRNTTNRIENATVTAQLPLYVRWLEMVSPASENITYNRTDNTITWHLGTLEPGVGYGDLPPRKVVFNIAFVPSASQYNTSPDLIMDQTFTGFDTFVEQTITTEADDLNIELDEPQFTEGQGKVQ